MRLGDGGCLCLEVVEAGCVGSAERGGLLIKVRGRLGLFLHSLIKLVVTSATLVVTGASLVVTKSY